jgi:hypothetical protein
MQLRIRIQCCQNHTGTDSCGSGSETLDLEANNPDQDTIYVGELLNFNDKYGDFSLWRFRCSIGIKKESDLGPYKKIKRVRYSKTTGGSQPVMQ